MKKSITSFARKSAQLVYEIAIERGADSYMDFETFVPSEFTEKIVDQKMHASKIKKRLAEVIAEDVDSRPDHYMDDSWETPGKMELRYQPDLMDFTYLIDIYISKLYEEKFPNPKPEPTIEDEIKALDIETLDKQILMVDISTGLLIEKSKKSKGHWKKVHKEKAHTMKELHKFLIKVKESKELLDFNFSDQIQLENRG